MSYFTEYGLEVVSKALFNLQAAPSTLYLALTTTSPTLLSTGSMLDEPSGGYARVAVINSDTTWEYSVNGFIKNKISIDFPKATAYWGSITHWSICSAATAGDLLLWNSFDNPAEVFTNQVVTVPAQSLYFTIKGDE